MSKLDDTPKVMTEKRCIICNGILSTAKDKSTGLLTCGSCGFMTADLDISREELTELYGTNYFHGEEYSDYVSDKPTIQKNFKFRLSDILKYTANSKEKTLFEIGCAYGFFLELARPSFKGVSGIDLSNDAINFAKNELNLKVHSGDFLDFIFPQKYDLFCMWDTIEHIREPHLYIKKISSSINDNGLLAITTGDISSINAKIRGKKWRLIHPPTHLHYFSQKNLELLLKQYGFKTIHVSHPGFYRSLDNIFYTIFSLKLKFPKFYHLLEATGLLKYSVYVNLYDIMFVIAKKGHD